MIAGVDAGAIGDGAELANCRPDHMAVLGDVRIVAHLDVFHHRAFAYFGPNTEVTIRDGYLRDLGLVV